MCIHFVSIYFVVKLLGPGVGVNLTLLGTANFPECVILPCQQQ